MRELQDAARKDDRRTLGAGGWKCWLGLHRWTRWGDPKKEERRKFDSFYSNVGVNAQYRECVRCGETKRREIGAHWNLG